MSEFVRKTAIGGYKEVPGGYPDPDCTHVIMTKREYDKLIGDVSEAKQRALDAGYAADRAAQRAISEAEEAAEREIEDVRRELAEERKESEFQRGLNKNLLRIARERANADRKLTPKKGHTGYVVVSSVEKERRYGGTARRQQEALLWETVLETPYSVDLGVDEVRGLLRELFGGAEGGECMIRDIGITGSYSESCADTILDEEWEEYCENHNLMLEHHLRANYRTGYWELIFLHTKPLTSVPANMKPRRRQ